MTDRERKAMLKLTPIQEAESGLLIKRDDLFQPFGPGRVNGGKLRQAMWMLCTDRPKGVITGASLSSPQNVIVSCVANYLKIPCICLYGGAKESSLQMPMPMLCKKYGAEIIVAKSGRHNVIYSMANELSQERGYQIIEYGMNAQDNIEAFYDANANQVQNIPDELDNLVVTCGSGITSTGIIYGLTKYRKKVKNLILVGTAPNREKKIQERLSLLGHPPAVFQYVDLFSQKGFSYDKREHSIIRMKDYSLELHPNYEAKVNNWIVNHIDPGKEKTLLWVVGVEPKR